VAKVRLGFVTNSSSSSFILSKKNLSHSQINKILNHTAYCRGKRLDFYCKESDQWTIEETEESIEGHTIMNNFNMEEFFRYLKINDTDYTFKGN
jgi:hypothetical protein